jgi:hypothetical protein
MELLQVLIKKHSQPKKVGNGIINVDYLRKPKVSINLR